MNAVVTGATSFLGRTLVDRLLKEGKQVFAVVRPGSLNMESLDFNRSGIVRVEWDMGELRRLDQVISEPCEWFYHLAWEGSGSENRRKREVQKKNAADSVKALEGAARLGCKRFLFSGSQAEYGNIEGLMSEEKECKPVSPYGEAKLEFLKLAVTRAKELGMEYVHARIFSVYGVGDHPWSLVCSCLRAFGRGEYISLGECSQRWNYLYAEDCVRALSLLMEQGNSDISGIYNIAAPGAQTRLLREYIRLMYEEMGCHGSYSYGRRRPNAEGPVGLLPDIRKMQAATGWEPQVEFSEGIRRTAKALKK